MFRLITACVMGAFQVCFMSASPKERLPDCFYNTRWATLTRPRSFLPCLGPCANPSTVRPGGVFGDFALLVFKRCRVVDVIEAIG